MKTNRRYVLGVLLTALAGRHLLNLPSALLMHTFLYFREQILMRYSLSEETDVHARLMSKYTPVPDWWYAAIFGE